MITTPSNPRNRLSEPTPANDRPVSNQHASDHPQPKSSTDRHPRIIEEHHVIGPHGEDEIEATDERGRRWYHLRPEPRRRADLIGFNFTWWAVIWVLLLFILLPWGGHWGWGY